MCICCSLVFNFNRLASVSLPSCSYSLRRPPACSWTSMTHKSRKISKSLSGDCRWDVRAYAAFFAFLSCAIRVLHIHRLFHGTSIMLSLHAADKNWSWLLLQRGLMSSPQSPWHLYQKNGLKTWRVPYFFFCLQSAQHRPLEKWLCYAQLCRTSSGDVCIASKLKNTEHAKRSEEIRTCHSCHVCPSCYADLCNPCDLCYAHSVDYVILIHVPDLMLSQNVMQMLRACLPDKATILPGLTCSACIHDLRV